MTYYQIEVEKIDFYTYINPKKAKDFRGIVAFIGTAQDHTHRSKPVVFLIDPKSSTDGNTWMSMRSYKTFIEDAKNHNELKLIKTLHADKRFYNDVDFYDYVKVATTYLFKEYFKNYDGKKENEKLLGKIGGKYTNFILDQIIAGNIE